MKKSDRKIHHILWIEKNIFSNDIHYPKQYNIVEYGTYNSKFQELKDMKTFKNKYELKLYLAIKGVKFDKFKTYPAHSGAKLIGFYDE